MTSQAAAAAARSAANPYRVLIAGGCYGGLAAAVNLIEKCDTIENPIPIDITIVDERDGYYHLIGSPLALSSVSYSEKAWVVFKDIPVLQRPDVRFVHGSLSKVDCERKVATILEFPDRTPREQSYDFFVAATGLRREWPTVPQSTTRETYLEETRRHIEAVTAPNASVLVVGGGAVGIEMAAELKYVQPHVKVTLAHSRDKLLSAEPLPDSVKDCALELTQQGGVEVLLNHRLLRTTPIPSEKKDGATEEEAAAAYEVEFENGHRLKVTHVIMAVSRSVPTSGYLPPAALADDGYVLVRPTLQLQPSVHVPNADTHFAVGDMISWTGIKRCGSAMYQGLHAGRNIHQMILQDLRRVEGGEIEPPVFMEISPTPPMIGLAVGNTALAYGTDGMKHGRQIMEWYFEEDLGFRICWDHIRLGGLKA
ncbi:FAD/NAD(P)-binding domain-containing protein [Durotheca rogersii]|uniref:FAD/NAD(P)-binding domain-containing protein n=1 Tax=Durotheca rogersii TaxID=419775 RepID=UPI002220A9E5|nr:FAD/NAD(P)-binding domain-containing protein [Durotheca rogersii]KAI5867900.1 FAD/NAD(P)-binding domain-containing protein [Durotheca rogersii]